MKTFSLIRRKSRILNHITQANSVPLKRTTELTSLSPSVILPSNKFADECTAPNQSPSEHNTSYWILGAFNSLRRTSVQARKHTTFLCLLGHMHLLYGPYLHAAGCVHVQYNNS